VQILAYIGLLFIVFGSWAIPAWAQYHPKAAGIVLMLAVDAALIWFWFRYGFS
jgi:hypothetical protein